MGLGGRSGNSGLVHHLHLGIEPARCNQHGCLQPLGEGPGPTRTRWLLPLQMIGKHWPWTVLCGCQGTRRHLANWHYHYRWKSSIRSHPVWSWECAGLPWVLLLLLREDHFWLLWSMEDEQFSSPPPALLVKLLQADDSCCHWVWISLLSFPFPRSLYMKRSILFSFSFFCQCLLAVSGLETAQAPSLGYVGYRKKSQGTHCGIILQVFRSLFSLPSFFYL